MLRYKRFWGSLVWKHGKGLSRFLSCLAWLMVFLIVVGMLKYIFGFSVPYWSYVISISFVLAVFVAFNSVKGSMWIKDLPEYKFEQIMKRAELLSALEHVHFTLGVRNRLLFIMNKAEVGRIKELEDWMDNWGRYERMNEHIACIEKAYSALPSSQKVLLNLKKSLQI